MDKLRIGADVGVFIDTMVHVFPATWPKRHRVRLALVQERCIGRYNLKLGVETPAQEIDISYARMKGDADKRQRDDRLARAISNARLLKETRHSSVTKHLRSAGRELQ